MLSQSSLPVRSSAVGHKATGDFDIEEKQPRACLWSHSPDPPWTAPAWGMFERVITNWNSWGYHDCEGQKVTWFPLPRASSLCSSVTSQGKDFFGRGKRRRMIQTCFANNEAYSTRQADDFHPPQFRTSQLNSSYVTGVLKYGTIFPHLALICSTETFWKMPEGIIAGL